MSKTNLGIIIVAVLVVAAMGSLVVYKHPSSTSNVPVAPVACTAEAKVCPDGSSVGRSGPKCEFAACPAINSILTEAQARAIAEKSCIKGGEALGAGTYNSITKTWWYNANLNATKPGCSPACVVNEQTKTAEINWRCTGLIPAK